MSARGVLDEDGNLRHVADALRDRSSRAPRLLQPIVLNHLHVNAVDIRELVAFLINLEEVGIALIDIVRCCRDDTYPRRHVRFVDNRMHVVAQHRVVLVPGRKSVLARDLIGLRIKCRVKLLHPVRGLGKVSAEGHVLRSGKIEARPKGLAKCDVKGLPVEFGESGESSPTLKVLGPSGKMVGLRASFHHHQSTSLAVKSTRRRTTLSPPGCER